MVPFFRYIIKRPVQSFFFLLGILAAIAVALIFIYHLYEYEIQAAQERSMVGGEKPPKEYAEIRKEHWQDKEGVLLIVHIPSMLKADDVQLFINEIEHKLTYNGERFFSYPKCVDSWSAVFLVKDDSEIILKTPKQDYHSYLSVGQNNGKRFWLEIYYEDSDLVLYEGNGPRLGLI